MALHYTRGDGYYEQFKADQKLYKYNLTSDLGEKSDLIRQKRMENDFYGMVFSSNYNNLNGLITVFGGGSMPDTRALSTCRTSYTFRDPKHICESPVFALT